MKRKNKNKDTVVFPKSLLAPVGNFLGDQLKNLQMQYHFYSQNYHCNKN